MTLSEDYAALKQGTLANDGAICVSRGHLMPFDPKEEKIDIQSIADNNANFQHAIMLTDKDANQITLYPATATVRAKSPHSSELVSFDLFPSNYKIEQLVTLVNDDVLNSIENNDVNREFILVSVAWPVTATADATLRSLIANRPNFQFIVRRELSTE